MAAPGETGRPFSCESLVATTLEGRNAAPFQRDQCCGNGGLDDTADGKRRDACGHDLLKRQSGTHNDVQDVGHVGHADEERHDACGDERGEVPGREALGLKR